ncbi:MAG: peptidoglycan editing factor PgeF [Candidatus Hydrogenedentes bacterium]|nr:peptidoglycan editing factor PgeF [Candidatus Hydrogenedentota bacterium]
MDNIEPVVRFVAGLAKISGLVAAISTREGGVSKPPYDSANMALHVGDDPAAVLENRYRICSELGIDAGDLVCAEQVHANRVVRVTEGDRGSGATSADDALPVTDGLLTDVRGLPLVVFTADCVPVFVYEPTRKVVGIAHAGWRGTLFGVAEALIATMENVFGGDPQSCKVALGPSAGPCCYEVGDEVVSAFQENGYPEEKIFSRTGHDKFNLNLWEVNALQLEKSRVPRDNISCSPQCSVCSSTYFSCRRDGAVTGRNMSVIMLK